MRRQRGSTDGHSDRVRRSVCLANRDTDVCPECRAHCTAIRSAHWSTFTSPNGGSFNITNQHSIGLPNRSTDVCPECSSNCKPDSPNSRSHSCSKCKPDSGSNRLAHFSDGHTNGSSNHILWLSRTLRCATAVRRFDRRNRVQRP